MLRSEEQPLKAFLPTVLTPVFKPIVFNAEQPLKQFSGTSVNAFGIVIVVSADCSKALEPIELMLSVSTREVIGQ